MNFWRHFQPSNSHHTACHNCRSCRRFLHSCIQPPPLLFIKPCFVDYNTYCNPIGSLNFTQKDEDDIRSLDLSLRLLQYCIVHVLSITLEKVLPTTCTSLPRR